MIIMGLVSFFIFIPGYRIGRNHQFKFGLTFGGFSLFAGILGLILLFSIFNIQEVFDDKLLI